MAAPSRAVRSRSGNFRREGHWYLWLARILFAATLLLERKHSQQVIRSPRGCPAVGVDDFWITAHWLAVMYFVVDFGSCFFFACNSVCIRQSLGHMGRSLGCASALLASWGLFLYVRTFSSDIRCVGIFGVIAMLCLFVFIMSAVIWWVVVECDACHLETNGIGDGDSGRASANPLNWACCRVLIQLFCNLEAWPIPLAPDLERGDGRKEDASRPSPSPETSRGSPMGSSGSKDERKENDGHKITFRVLGRNGEALFTSRSQHSVRVWIKRNLDREKRKGVLIEEKRRSRRVKRLSPASAQSKS